LQPCISLIQLFIEKCYFSGEKHKKPAIELPHGVPDSDEERDPGEAVQGVEEYDEAPEPEADLQQEDILGALSYAPAAVQTMLPRENSHKQKRKPNTPEEYWCKL
jgi:hypothetical protein